MLAGVMKVLQFLLALVLALFAATCFSGPFYTGVLKAVDLGACNAGIHYYGLWPADGRVVKDGGSINPSNYGGYEIRSLVASADASPQCRGSMMLVLAGDAPQNLFNTLFVNGNLYTSATASEYVTGHGLTIWRWYNRPQGVPARGNFSVMIW